MHYRIQYHSFLPQHGMHSNMKHTREEDGQYCKGLCWDSSNCVYLHDNVITEYNSCFVLC